MDILIAVLLAGGIITIGAQLARRRQDARAAAAVPLERRAELEALRVGDIVVHGRADLIVTTVVELVEGPRCWREYALHDDGVEHWLVLHPDDAQHALLGRRVEGLPIVGEPPESLEHAGRIYRLRGAGQAQAESDAPAERGVCDHWEYDRPGAQRLWIRRVGGALRACAGERVARHLLDALPGDEAGR